jgi:hypothetical protein
MLSFPAHFHPGDSVTWFTVTGEERHGVIAAVGPILIVNNDDDSVTHSAPENVADLLHFQYPLHTEQPHPMVNNVEDNQHYLVASMVSGVDARMVATTMNDMYYALKDLHQRYQELLQRDQQNRVH